jgi:hypothetical protein
VFVVGATDGAFAGEAAIGGTDAFLTRVGVDGAVLGTTVFGTGDDDRVDDVALTPRGDVLVVFASGVSYTVATLAKFSPCGSEAWSVSAGTLSSGGLAVHPNPPRERETSLEERGPSER